MRPTAKPQSALRAPLNDILGTEANVRLLRALAAGPTPLPSSELARLTKLHISGIAKALAALEETGVVEFVGSGSRRPARLRDAHPLVPALRSLFHAERERAEGVLAALRKAASSVYPVPMAVWVQGRVVLGVDSPADPIIVVVLTEPQHVEVAREGLETSLGDIERELDIVVEVRVRTRADLAVAADEEREEFAHALPLVGPPPDALLDDPGKRPSAKRVRGRMHAHRDAGAHALATAIVDRLRTDPSLVVRAREWVNGRLESAAGGERRELREWDRILRTMSVPRLRRFLVDRGERATRLRQTLPFLNVLSASERRELLDAASRQSDAEEAG